MTTHLKSLLLTLTLMCAFSASATAQTTSNSTPTSPAALSEAQQQLSKEAEEVKREAEALRLQLRIRRLLNEVKAGRKLMSDEQRELGTADAQLEAEKRNSASLEKSRALLSGEVSNLLDAVDQLTGAIKLKSEAMAVLEKRNGELKRSASKNRKRAFWATAAAVVLGGVLVLK